MPLFPSWFGVVADEQQIESSMFAQGFLNRESYFCVLMYLSSLDDEILLIFFHIYFKYVRKVIQE